MEAARNMVYQVASLLHQDPNSADIPKFASMAKWIASDTAMKMTTDAV